MKNVKLVMALGVAALLAFMPVSFASSIEVQEDGVKKGNVLRLNFNGASVAVSGGTASIQGAVAAFTSGTITGLTLLSSERVFATIMMYLPYYAPADRPASGAQKGSIISKGGTSATDCGTAHGSVYVVCTSNGTNWIALT
jgi:hypothetical protein